MNLVVIGMGYVGIPSAVLFADVEGIDVIGYQRRSKRSGWKIDVLNSGKSPIEGNEPGLAELIEKVVKNGKFVVTDNPDVINNADVILIDVQTPVDIDHIPKFKSLREVCSQIGCRMKKGALIGIESTVAPGTTENIAKPILEKASCMKVGLDFNLIYSYERVMVGRLLYNLQHMPRIVGGVTPDCAKKGAALYRKITKSNVFVTDCLTAEISKVTENAYRDVNIAFANEVALICESLGVNVHDVRKYVNSLPYDPSDPGKNPYRMMMTPGAGVGGHCLPKDSWLLKYGVDNYGDTKVSTDVIVHSRKINDHMPNHMMKLINESLQENHLDPKKSDMAILGYAFLENSDDVRNTPALPLYQKLEAATRKVIVHDPHVKNVEGINITNNLTKAVQDMDCLIVVTKHNEYYNIDPTWLKKKMRTPVIVDGRNVFNPQEVKKLGFTFKGIGIGKLTD